MVGDSFYDAAGGAFRVFVNNMYYAAMKERNRYGQDECSLQEYFDGNKYWLKHRFKDTGGNMLDIMD
jgi:hypothetical protein